MGASYRKGMIVTALLALALSFGTAASEPERALIFYNRACGDCTTYIEEELIPLLGELGIVQVDKKDFVNDRANRRELNERSERLGIPPRLQGHFTVFIGDRIVLQGHVPPPVIRDLLTEADQSDFERIVVYQDEMGDRARSYKVWAFRGEIQEYPIDAPIGEYLNWFRANQENLSTQVIRGRELWDFKSFLPLILLTGLLDGINPCAFAVLLFFIAFLFTIHRTKAQIVKVGSVYIAMIYLTYLGIGLGLLEAFVLTGEPHLMAKVGAGLVIALGLVNVKDYFWYGRWFSLHVPKVGEETRERWAQKATLPATVVLGILVGLCTFPCTGGIYVATLGLLSAKATYLMGFGYLLLYNVMFVAPLIAILLVVSNHRMVGQLTRWENAKKRSIKLTTGVVMISLGVVILVWFV
ncbi:MAG: cytochrome c biogenesis CcdA family protein [Candidatus Bipolaricaulia bacterium]